MRKRVVQLLAHNPPVLPEGGPAGGEGAVQAPPGRGASLQLPTALRLPHPLNSLLWVPSSMFTCLKK